MSSLVLLLAHSLEGGVGAGRETADDLLRRAVGLLVGTAPEAVRVGRVCPHCGSTAHGRPVVLPSRAVRRPPRASLARSPGLLLAAITVGGPVGIDVEVPEDPRFVQAHADLLHPGEAVTSPAELALICVRKTSLFKATGDGSALDPRLVRLSPPSQAPALLEWGAPGSPPRSTMHDLDLPGHVGCVTVLSSAQPELSLHWETAGAAGL